MGGGGGRVPWAPPVGLGPGGTWPRGRSRKDAGPQESTGLGSFPLASVRVRTHTPLMTTTNTEMTATMAAYRARIDSAQARGDDDELRVLELVHACATVAVAAQQRREGRRPGFFTEPSAEDEALFNDILEHECAARGYPLR